MRHNRINSAGIIATASFTPVAEAYGAGDIVDAAKEFAFVMAETGETIPPGSLIRILSSSFKTAVSSVPSGMTSFSLKTYLSAPDITIPDPS